MNSDNVVYVHIHNRTLFSYEKGGNPASYKNVHEPGGYYIKWNKPDTERQNTAWYYLHVESNIVKLIEAKSIKAKRARGWDGGNEELWVKEYKVSVMQGK